MKEEEEAKRLEKKRIAWETQDELAAQQIKRRKIGIMLTTLAFAFLYNEGDTRIVDAWRLITVNAQDRRTVEGYPEMGVAGGHERKNPTQDESMA